MLGSTTLIIPLYFARAGILNCLFVMMVHMLINYKTGNILITHGKITEMDLPEIIDRLLGKGYLKLYSIMSSSLLFLVAIIYYLIQCNMIFGLFQQIFQYSELPMADRD